MVIDVNHQNNEGKSALLSATSNGDVAMIELLHKFGGDVNLANKYELSPLIAATVRNSVSVVDRLIELGADIEFSPTRTALFETCEDENHKVIQALLRAGATISEETLAEVASHNDSQYEELLRATIKKRK